MKIYLAIPYSFDPEVSFRVANIISARLMSEGHVVFSPISHSHPIADYLPDELRKDSEWWMKQDIPFVEWADELHVVHIGEEGAKLVNESKGVIFEIEHARYLNKPMKILEYVN